MREGVTGDHMALHIGHRFEFNDLIDVLFNISLQMDILLDVIQNNSVLTINKQMGYYLMRDWRERYDLSAYTEGVDYYFSEPEENSLNYFIVLNNQVVSDELVHSFNKVIASYQGNGIYELEVRNALKPKGFGPEIDERPKSYTNVRPIAMNNLIGVNILLIVGLIISCALLVLECITKCLDNYYFNLVVSLYH